jgi:hypothetical protein
MLRELRDLGGFDAAVFDGDQLLDEADLEGRARQETA